jgi:hypothetical protein
MDNLFGAGYPVIEATQVELLGPFIFTFIVIFVSTHVVFHKNYDFLCKNVNFSVKSDVLSLN